jgi:protein-L-isoaspartate(D-aspartate) O-methyltransferase
MARSPASADRLVEKLRRYIGDERVLAAMAAVPRHLFVPEDVGRFAWDNTALPIGSGQTISQPVVVARMCELLELGGDEKVLDVGTGSGYHAAVLAYLAGEVWGIERHRSLAAQARANLAAAGIDNVHVIVGDGSEGYPSEAPYDAINVAAAATEIPAALEAQLADGGRLVTPLDGADQRLALERRDGDRLEVVLLDPVRFVPLVSGEG